MATKKYPYVNRFTGDVVVVSKQHGKKLSEDWGRAQFIKNEEGKQVMRIQLEGATVDIAENEQPVEVVPDGKRSTE